MTGGPSVSNRRLWIAVTLALVAAAIAVRWAINFSHPYPPGTDAAYYPLQTRFWLEHGRLMYEDLPLIFWIDAAVTKGLTAAGRESDAAVLFASRFVDCVLPPWTAAGVMALGYHWAKGRPGAIAGCAAAALVTVFWPPAMIMLSEFEKNSLGLVWMVAAAWACLQAMHHGGWRRWAVLAGVVTLAALTHVGAFGATALMVGLALLLGVVAPMIQTRRIPAGKALARLAAVVLPLVLLTLAMAAFAPGRAAALVAGPVTLFRNPGLGSGQQVPVVSFVLSVVVVAFAVRRLWRDRTVARPADMALVVAAGLTALVLAAPKNADYLWRLALMADVPAAIVFAYLMARRGAAGRSSLAGVAALVFVGAIAALTVPRSRPIGAFASVVQAADGDELRQLRAQVAEPESTLVVASHGFEWWAGYFLHTPVRTGTAGRNAEGALLLEGVPADAFTRYRRVLFLRGVRPAPPGEPATPPAATDGSLSRIHAGRAFELYEVHRTAAPRR